MMFSFTISLPSSPFSGREPISRFRSSPLTIWLAGRFICSPPRWGSRSVTQNTGSVSSSPMRTVTVEPSLRTITPCSASGMVVHWYFLIPP